MCELSPHKRLAIQVVSLGLAVLGLVGNVDAQEVSEGASAGDLGAKPNIVLLFVDDLGWADLGYRNDKFESPNVDQLVKESLDFQQAYIACPTCSPSRATLLTGKHPARIGMVRHIPTEKKHSFDKFGRTEVEWNYWPSDPAQVPCRNWLPLEHITYAEALHDLGYYNQFIGKWHLGHEPYHPIHQGFDSQIGTSNAGHPKSYYPPFFKNSDVLADEKTAYLTDKLTDASVNFIQEYDRAQPFMLSMWYYNVHRPPVGRKDFMKYFLEKGYEKKDAIYASQIKAMDESVGRIRNALSKKGIANNTVVIFLSDQGGIFENGNFRGGKKTDTLCEGGARVPMMIHWPGVIDPGSSSNDLVQSTDLFPTLIEIAGGDAAKFQDLDGVSLMETLKTQAPVERIVPLIGYRAYEDMYASVRDGDWKLIAYRSGEVHLYNIAKDVGEQNNVAKENPGIVSGLTQRLIVWESEMNLQQYSGVQ